MPTTQINAFFGAVDAAKADVVAAKGRLAAAEAALETKKKEVGWQEPQAPETTEQPEDTSPDPKPNTGSVFRKK